MKPILRISIIISAIVCNGYAMEQIDSVCTDQVSDTAITADAQENEFQQDLDELFNDEYPAIDTTFAWDNLMINSGHFDSQKWTDTAEIAIVDSAKGLNFVMPFKNYITSNFGPRRKMWHYGVDIKLAKGDTVRAAFDGIVRVTKNDRHGFGQVVVIRHPYGLETIYGHLSKKLAAVNQKVKAGEVIGLGGNTGHSTGSHLHFEMRYYGEPFDPNSIIDFTEYQLKQDTLVLSRANFDYLEQRRAAKWHTVQKGDTLMRIARSYNTTIKMLCRLNRFSPRTILRRGQKILIHAQIS